MKKGPAHQPKVEKVSVAKLRCLNGLEYLLTGLLMFTGAHILAFYIRSIFNPNIVETMAVKYAVYIAIGSFFYLFVYYKAIWERWGPKDVPPYEKNPSKKL